MGSCGRNESVESEPYLESFSNGRRSRTPKILQTLMMAAGSLTSQTLQSKTNNSKSVQFSLSTGFAKGLSEGMDKCLRVCVSNR